MADKQSREGNFIIRECYICKNRDVYRADSLHEGRSCSVCDKPTSPVGFTDNPPKPAVTKKNDGLSIKIEMDVSDALKGLKAVQREAKKTVHALKEVEELSDKRMIESLTDEEIFTILSSRGWEIETAVLSDGFGNPNVSSVNMYKNYKQQEE